MDRLIPRFLSKKKIILILCFAQSLHLIAQIPDYTSKNDLVFIENNHALQYPLTGGLASPQMNSMDLNNDGVSDLVVFDKVGNKILTFIHSGTPNLTEYQYAPEYESAFPKCQNFVHLIDFNCDGIEDIFTTESIAPPNALLTIYKGMKTDNGLQFKKMNYDLNDSVGYLISHVFDIPAITDLNGDGDIDFIHFPSNSDHISYYENLSQELGFGCDELIFELRDECWGGIGYTSGDTLELDACDGLLQSQTEAGGCLGAFVMTEDFNGDGSKDLLYSSLFTNTLSLLLNTETSSEAFFKSQNPDYLLDEVAEYSDFPAASSADFNNDNIMDLSVISNRYVSTLSGSGSEKVFYFQNNGTNDAPVFEIVTETFLLEETVDHGFRSVPTSFDYNNDGLTDIVNGINAADPFFTYKSRLILYENIGTLNEPEFTLADEDYLNISNTNLKAIHPTFGDLDLDEDIDLLLGDVKGKLYYFENIAGQGALPEFQFVDTAFTWVDVGNHSRPQVTDVNGDNLNDILIGSAFGKITFLKNTGTAELPHFERMTKNLGNILKDTFNVESCPWLTNFEEGGEPFLLVSDKSGKIQVFEPDFENFDLPFELVEQDLAGIDVGSGATIQTIDLDNDKIPEILMGNERGGINVFIKSNEPVTQTNQILPPLNLPIIFPNPTKDFINIAFEKNIQKPATFEIYNLTGQLLMTQRLEPFQKKFNIEISSVETGIYICKISNNEITLTYKIAVSD